MQLAPPPEDAPRTPAARLSLPTLWRRLLALLTVAVTIPLLTSCYVPNDFVAEIRLSHDGDFALIYQGNLTWAPLYKEIREGRLTVAEIQDKESALVRDLERDGAFKQVIPLGSGTFKVRYELKGRFTGTRAVTFVRRSAALLTMELKPDGTVHIWSSSDPKLRNPEQLESLGLRTQGRLRIITDAPVLRHNAYRVVDSMPGYPAYRVYDWTINSVRTPRPTLVARLFNPELTGRPMPPPP